MSHTLTDGATTIELSQNMDWADEFDWTPVEQSTQYALSGALLIDEDTKLAGRPITLVPAPNMGSIPKAALDQLHTWAAVSAQQLTLTLHDGRAFNVRFAHTEKAVDTTPVRGFRVPTNTEHDLWKTTLRFIEV